MSVMDAILICSVFVIIFIGVNIISRRKKSFCELSRRQQLRRIHAFRHNEPNNTNRRSSNNSELNPCANDNYINIPEVDNDNSNILEMSVTHHFRKNLSDFFPNATNNEKYEMQPNSNVMTSKFNDSSFDFLKFLQQWHVLNNVSQSITTQLLCGLRNIGFHDLPSCARTLVKTPRTNRHEVLGNGLFSYYGIKKAILDQLEYIETCNISSDIYLWINVDGIPISKSSHSELWPILGKIDNLALSEVFTIAVYHGKGKPSPIHDYLNSFITEFKDLHKNGFFYKGRTFKVHLKSFLADTPARNYLMCFPGHNSRCARCVQKGSTINHRRLFLEMNSSLRTDSNFRIDVPNVFLNIKSPLEDIDISMTTQFPLDYMHMICLGVMKKLIGIWIDVFSKMRGVNDIFTAFNEMYCQLGSCLPREFGRKPRSMLDYKRWKATEFRTFLLYFGPIVLQYFLPRKYLIHFNSLSCACRILCDQNQYNININYANDLLKYFVTEMRTLYGRNHLIYNIHNLLHLCDDVRRYGPLDNFSVFEFENFLQIIKNKIKSGALPLSQVMNRLVERSKYLPRPHHSNSKYRLLNPNEKIQLPDSYNKAFDLIEFSNFTLSSQPPDNCCYLKDHTVVIITHICHDVKNSVIIGHHIVDPLPLNGYPCDSRALGIYNAMQVGAESKSWPISEIDQKGFVIRIENFYYVVPMIHKT